MQSKTRRSFLRDTALGAVVSIATPYCFSPRSLHAADSKSANERLNFGCIGNGGMGRADANAAKRHGNLLAFCDVDSQHSMQFRQDEHLGNGRGDVYEDYRWLLDRSDIDAVTISTPDHWHAKIASEAMLAGKDVYCQKPLTLTIDEGKMLCRIVKKTGRVLQVGTQQRSEFGNRFLKAVALAKAGRIGKIRRATVAIGSPPAGKVFKKIAPPRELNWEKWLGPAPMVDYIPERSHRNFRWWYEYSGGKMTDWGAHHVDIATWALGLEETGPVSVELMLGELPIPFESGYPTVDNSYNTASRFNVLCRYENGMEIVIRHDAQDLGFENGIMFEGDGGRFFVNRNKLTGKPVEELVDHPLPHSVFQELRNGKPLGSHMANFSTCVKDRSLPVSDVYTHHRALTTCHLANIAIRIGRNLRWDPVAEQIINDEQASQFTSRSPRAGYETQI